MNCGEVVVDLFGVRLRSGCSVMLSYVSLLRELFDSVDKHTVIDFVKETHFIGSRPSDHYFRSVRLSVCLFVCAEFFSAVFDPIWITLGHMLHVRF